MAELSRAEAELSMYCDDLLVICRRRLDQICAVSAAVKPKSLAIRIKARRASEPIS